MSKGYINLRKKNQSVALSAPPEKMEPSGPTLYIHDIDLPLTADDLDKEIEVKAKIKLKNIRESIHNGDQETSYDVEVLGLNFNE